MNIKKLTALLCAVVMVLSLAACGGSGDKAENKHYTVGICQLVQHDALDAATKGFRDAITDALGADNVTFDEQNAAGDSATCATICNGFVSSGVDLILANATGALQAAAAATKDIPILGTAVTEYGVALGIDNFSGTVGGNISGTSDLAPLDQQAAMITELFPDAKNVGIIYCSGEPNSVYQADVVKAALEKAGCTVTIYTFADTNDVVSVTGTASDANDVLYVPDRQHRRLPCAEAIKGAATKPIVAGGGGHLQGLRRCDAVHRLLRARPHHRRDGREDPQGRGRHLHHGHRVLPEPGQEVQPRDGRALQPHHPERLRGHRLTPLRSSRSLPQLLRQGYSTI